MCSSELLLTDCSLIGFLSTDFRQIALAFDVGFRPAIRLDRFEVGFRKIGSGSWHSVELRDSYSPSESSLPLSFSACRSLAVLPLAHSASGISAFSCSCGSPSSGTSAFRSSFLASSFAFLLASFLAFLAASLAAFLSAICCLFVFLLILLCLFLGSDSFSEIPSSLSSVRSTSPSGVWTSSAFASAYGLSRPSA